MCKISKETIIIANEKTMRRNTVELRKSNILNNELVVSTFFCGTEYTQRVSLNELTASYKRSFEMVVKSKK